MYHRLGLLFICCFFQRFITKVKQEIMLPKKFLFVPFEMEPYQIEYIYSVFQ